MVIQAKDVGCNKMLEVIDSDHIPIRAELKSLAEPSEGGWKRSRFDQERDESRTKEIVNQSIKMDGAVEKMWGYFEETMEEVCQNLEMWHEYWYDTRKL